MKTIGNYKNLISFRLTIVVLLLIASILPATKSAAQSASSHYLLALSKSDHVLAIIDPVTLNIVAKVPVGPDPHEVIASADGKIAYVSNYGGGSLHELDVIDLVAQKALPAIDSKPLIGLHGLAFAEGKVWFTAEGAKLVGRYDPATGKFDWCLGTGQNRTHMIYVAPGAKQVYTTNVASATVSILTDSLVKPNGGPGGPGGFPPPPNGQQPPPPGQGGPGGFIPQPHQDWVQTLIPVGKGSEGFDVSPDGRELWTAGAEDGTITIINIAAKQVSTTIDAKVNGANRLKFTPDGKLVLISSLRTGDLFIYNTITHKEIKRINTGRGAAGILVDEDGSRAFIGCTADDYVAVVDLKTLTVTGHIAVRGADGLAWAVKP